MQRLQRDLAAPARRARAAADLRGGVARRLADQHLARVRLRVRVRVRLRVRVRVGLGLGLGLVWRTSTGSDDQRRTEKGCRCAVSAAVGWLPG